jgi:ligand-binding sensor domain-containing protein/signal transduction histidine kinase
MKVIVFPVWNVAMRKDSLLTKCLVKKSGVFKQIIPIKYVLVITSLLSMFIKANAEQKVLQFKHLSVDNGLSSSQVVSILQDYKGFMWFGSTNGLNRYDGNTIAIYKNIPSDPKSLPENHVRALFEDRKKNLFVGTWGGLSQYDRDLNCFVNFRFQKTSPLYNMEMSVFRIAEDSLGNLWLATNNGLVFFDRNNNKVVRFNHDPQNSGSISNDIMDCVYFDKRGRLWIGSRKGLNLFNMKTGNFEHVTRCKTEAEDFSDIFFMDIVEDKQGDVWFGSTAGLFRLENRKDNDAEPMELSHFKNNPLDPNSLSNNRARSLFVDDEGNVWIGTENGGINLYNRNTNNFSHYRIEEFNSMSLNNESIHAMTQDRSKNFWVGTWGGGVNIASNNSGFIVHYKNLPGAPQSLSSNIVSCIVENPFNRIWVGTLGKGLNLFEEKTGRFTRFNKNNTDMKSDAITAMIERNNCEIWMGTWEGGLVRYNYLENKLTSLTTHNSGIPDNSIYSIAQDAQGDLWLGSYRHGLMYYQVKKNKFTTYAPKETNLDNTEISVVRIDHKGQVFLGTNNGSKIFIFIPSEKRFVGYTILPDSMSQGTNSAFDILIENDTCTWVATQKGLYRFNPLNSNYKWFFREDECFETSIQGLTLDKDGMLWVTTNSGMYRFDTKTNVVKHFTTSDGLQGNEFFRASIVTRKSGTILAGGTNGFNLISPHKYSENRTIPQVVITDFHLFNAKVKIGDKNSPLAKHISETRKMTLSYKQSVITFYFAVLDFSNPDKNQYAYRMENFDKGWIYCGDRKEATYTNLNPGRYRFHVKGSNNDGIWNEDGTTMDITITPPWWKTKLALASFIFLILICLFSFYYYRITQLKRQKSLLENLVMKRTHEIEEKTSELAATNEKLILLNATKDKFFSIIAHDLKNPFTSILGFCDILSRRYDTFNDTTRIQAIQVINESSKKIFQLLENLLQWARSQTGNIQYAPQEFIINEVVEANLLLVKTIASQKKLEMRKNIENEITVYADRNMVDTVIRNLLTNAIKFTESGYVGIEVIQGNNSTEVKISDTGVGINNDKLEKLFVVGGAISTRGTRGESGTGLGLAICNEFIKKHGGTISILSTPGKGTTFSFSISNVASKQV